MSKTRVVNIDLYELYEKRIKESVDLDGTFKVGETLFKDIIRVILACDAIHDFMGDRTNVVPDSWRKPKVKQSHEDIKNIFAGSIKFSLKQDLSGNRAALNKFLGQDIFDERETFFTSTTKAEELVKSIIEKLGLEKMSLSNIMKGDCSNDNSIIRMIDILSLHEYKKYDIPPAYDVLEQTNKNMPALYSILRSKNPIFPPIRVYVDMTSSTINLIPIYAGILNNERNIQNGCGGVKDIKMNYDYASVYDPSNVESIFKGFKASGLVNVIKENIKFNINIGTENIIECELKETEEDGVINLTIYKFFNMERYTVRKEKIIISLPNKDNDKKINSPKEITKTLLSKGPVFGKDSNYIYRNMLPKTVGDFLQIMSFLDPEINSSKIFVTGDIICNCIASIFSKFSLGEIKNTAIPVLNGLGIYSTKIEKDAFTAVSVLAGMKRARTDFGKSIKYKDIKNLKEKLISVGIKVTKKLKDKAVSLTKKELERKAHLFKKLQLKAKDKQIELKNKNGKFKTKERLEKELKKNSFKKTSFG